jgi:hypothetical protein
MPRFQLTLLIFALLSAWSPLGRAASEIVLSNGDRITGDILRREDGVVVVRSALLGELRIPESALAPSRPQTAASPGKPTATPAAVAATKAPPPPSKKPDNPASAWNLKLEAGYQQTSGRRDSIYASGRMEADRKIGRTAFRASARALYGEDSQWVNTDRLDASFRLRRDIRPTVFLQATTSYLRDDVKRIPLNVEQAAGVGWKVLERPADNATVGVAATGQLREAFGSDRFMTLFGEVFHDYTHKFNGRLSIKEEVSVLYSPVNRSTFILIGNKPVATDPNAENYRIRFNAVLEGKMTDHLSLNLRYEYEFDNSLADPSVQSDQRITSSLGYAF